MANVLKFSPTLGASASLALSSRIEFSSSSASSITACSGLLGFKNQKLSIARLLPSISQRTSFRLIPSRCQRGMWEAEDNKFEDYYKKVSATESNQLRDLITQNSEKIEKLTSQLALSNEEIKKLNASIHGASKDLKTVIKYLKENPPFHLKVEQQIVPPELSIGKPNETPNSNEKGIQNGHLIGAKRKEPTQTENSASDGRQYVFRGPKKVRTK